MSISENVLWTLIRKEALGFGFKRQVPVGNYWLDFYCPEAKLCIEVDGEQHLLRADRDVRRDQALLEMGIKTIRVPSLDLFERTSAKVSAHLESITRECEQRSRRLRHEKRFGGER
ncbi:cytosolic protein [Fimbriimonas ginsengisoli Gsoil 348]|uniref:Cytosolic protein n=2 Tax=Fimbriimonas ginsengisoli TaxID=1005039 RepID=A0A068NP49_FIMGI|nr:cytosolic protein [Fimbriimonas ginsengisoli Gsoil 348]